MALLRHLRFAAPTLRLTEFVKRWQRHRRLRSRPTLPGHCPVCSKDAGFAETDPDNPRESPMCKNCGSVPRQRALIRVIAELGLKLDDCRVHESSPSLATWRHFHTRCRDYLASYWFPGVENGARIGAFRCVDLHAQPLPDAAFDLVVTQDVLEHVAAPDRALREVERTLATGGRHVFTLPRDRSRTTLNLSGPSLHGVETILYNFFALNTPSKLLR